MSLEIVNGGALTTVQDLGRFGYMNKGFQVSGAVDDQAMRLANILVGNDQKEAVLEATIMGPTIRFTAPAVIAMAGMVQRCHCMKQWRFMQEIRLCVDLP